LKSADFLSALISDMLLVSQTNSSHGTCLPVIWQERFIPELKARFLAEIQGIKRTFAALRAAKSLGHHIKIRMASLALQKLAQISCLILCETSFNPLFYALV
jgi:hypothetical protein